MKKIRAIETHYKGYRFRSRLEARWAIYFDSVGIEWVYELEGYNLSDGRKYLPDFKITTIDKETYFYEIKPKHSKGDGKLECLIEDLRKSKIEVNGCVLSGDPYDYIITDKNYPCPRCMQFSLERDCCPFITDVYCFTCDIHTPEGGGNEPEEHFGIITIPHKGNLMFVQLPDFKNSRAYWDIIYTGWNAARSARFEYGETPQIR